MFRKRFAIETSYRMINQFLPKTTSKLYSLSFTSTLQFFYTTYGFLLTIKGKR